MKDLIKPLEERQHIFSTNIRFSEPDVRELEQNHREAIEALRRMVINQIYHEETEYCLSENRAKAMFEKEISIIEKLTGQKWEELKDGE